jgi:hypothetical protein
MAFFFITWGLHERSSSCEHDTLGEALAFASIWRFLLLFFKGGHGTESRDAIGAAAGKRVFFFFFVLSTLSSHDATNEAISWTTRIF